jgi:hypothetical protein
MSNEEKSMKVSLWVNYCTCPICQSQVETIEKNLHRQINILMSTMNSRQRRLFAAFQAIQLGHGGITRMARISGLDRKTIRKGVLELNGLNQPKDAYSR